MLRTRRVAASAVLGIALLGGLFAPGSGDREALAQTAEPATVAPTPFAVPRPGDVQVTGEGTASRAVDWAEIQAWGPPRPRDGVEAFGYARVRRAQPIADLPPGERRDRLTALAEAYVRANPDVALDHVGFNAKADDCFALEARARAAAYANAAARIAELASARHVALGAAVAVDESDPDGCTRFASSGLPVDITTMRITITVQLTFWFDMPRAR